MTVCVLNQLLLVLCNLLFFILGEIRFRYNYELSKHKLTQLCCSSAI